MSKESQHVVLIGQNQETRLPANGARTQAGVHVETLLPDQLRKLRKLNANIAHLIVICGVGIDETEFNRSLPDDQSGVTVLDLSSFKRIDRVRRLLRHLS